jgi:hypothetical protein
VDTTPEVKRATALAAWLGAWLRDEEAKLGDRYNYPVTWPLGTLLALPATQMEQHRCRC